MQKLLSVALEKWLMNLGRNFPGSQVKSLSGITAQAHYSLRVTHFLR